MEMKRLLLGIFYLLTFCAFGQYQGIATHFDGLGAPYGGCGVPQDLLETQNFVALNVFNTPGVYTSFARPLTGADTTKMGEFHNGSNCGRWLKVTMGADCNGTNDGAQNQPFCRDGTGWFNDQYSGATLYMIVADACADGNAWCRDSRYHLDLATNSLNQFEINGQPVTDMYPTHFNNREISWEFVEAPNYSGDIAIYFMQGAQQYWPAIMINHLQNGISKVEQKVNGSWVNVSMNSDMGQAFILPNTNPPFTIRIYDASGSLINHGREYTFSLPAACGSTCSAPATLASYQTFDPVVTAVSDPQKAEVQVWGNHILIKDLSGNADYEVKILDLTGRVVKTYSAMNTYLQVKGLMPGLYLVAVFKNGTRISVIKSYFSQN